MENYPQNRDIRKQFYSLKRMYEKSIKDNKSQVKERLLEQLRSLHEKDSKTQYNIFNKLTNRTKSNVSPPIYPDEWVAYCKTVYNDESDDIRYIIEAVNLKQQK